MDKNYIERLNKMLDEVNDKIASTDSIQDEGEREFKKELFKKSKAEIEAQIAEAKKSKAVSQIGVVEDPEGNKKPTAKKTTSKPAASKEVKVDYVVVNDIIVPIYNDEVMNLRNEGYKLPTFDQPHSEFTKEKLAQEKELLNVYEWNPNALIDKQEIPKHEIKSYQDKEVIRSYEDTISNEKNDSKVNNKEVEVEAREVVMEQPKEDKKASKQEIKKESKKEEKQIEKSNKDFDRIPGEKDKFINVDLPEVKDDGVKALKQINKRQKQLTSKYSKQILNGAVVTTTNYKPDLTDHVIELHDVTKSYLTGDVETQVLKGIDIKLNKSDFIVILGPSGSGKTTFLNTISGLDKATKGDVFVLGYNLSLLKDSHLTKFRRKHVGFIFQQYNLLTNLTAKENAEVGENLSTNKNADMTIEDIFETIGMKEQMNKYPHQMSGGQQQRVSIARALAKNPDILFADEPTGALDEEMGRKVLEILVEVNRKYKTTVIVVTHNPNIAKIGNTVIHIKNGLVDKVIKNENPADPQTIDWS